MPRRKKTAPKSERQKIDERREEVLSKGRKFRYPLQYAKHKVVFNTIIIGVLAVVLLTFAGWLALYKLQDTGNIIYRVTQVLPVTVASVDGEPVRYSDYLMIYRSSITTVEQQGGQLGNDDEANELRQRYKRSALNNAEAYAYATKLARQYNISVSNEEVQEVYDEHRKVGGTERSEESFVAILSKNFGLSKAEYMHMLEMSILKAKVAQAIDQNAQNTVSQIEASLRETSDFAQIAAKLGDKVQYEETGGLVSNTNLDGGRAAKAMTLEPGQVSQKFPSSNGDGYYFVKLNSKNDTQVNYSSLKVKFTTFNEQLEQLRKSGAVDEAIDI